MTEPNLTEPNLTGPTATGLTATGLTATGCDADVCLVTTTVDARDVADALAGSAVAGRLAACAQVGGPITSTYRWQGAVETAQEWVVQFKTTAERADALVGHVRQAHPYDVPEVVVTPVTGGDPAYLSWVRAESTG